MVSWSARARRRGISLVEVALTIVIVGMGMVAVMQFFASGTQANAAASEQSVALQMARAGYEEARMMKWDDLRDLGDRVTDLGSGYQQQMSVRKVDLAKLTDRSTKQPDPADESVRLTVTTLHNNRAIYSCDWVLTKRS